MTNKIDFTHTAPTPHSQSPLTISSAPRPATFLTSTLSRMDAKAAETSCCDWLKNLFQNLFRFFGLSAPLETSAERAARILEERTAQGKRIIDDHLQRDFIINANTPNKALVVLISYNGESKIHYGRAQEVKNSTDVSKAMVRELLTRHASSPSAKLEINTMLFEKNNDHTFNFVQVDNNINFANGARMGGFGDIPGCNPNTLSRILDSSIPNLQHRLAVTGFLTNQL